MEINDLNVHEKYHRAQGIVAREIESVLIYNVI